MTDITSKKVIVLKGILFLFIMIGSSTVIVIKHPTLVAVLALCALIWASARFYYFLFYVLERYVDPGLRYSGLLALLSALLRHRNRSSGAASNFDKWAG